MLRVFFYKKNIILVNKLTYLLSGAFLSAKIVFKILILLISFDGSFSPVCSPIHP